MSNNKKIITLVGLVIVLAFSFLIFFGINTESKSGVEISAFIFTLVTELIIFGSVIALTSKKLNTFLVAGLSSLTVIYSICSLLFNVLLVSVFTTTRSILIFNFSLLLVFAFITTVVFLFKKEQK